MIKENFCWSHELGTSITLIHFSSFGEISEVPIFIQIHEILFKKTSDLV